MTDTPWTPGPWTARTNLAVMQGNWDREQGTKWDRGKPRPEHATNAWVSSAGEKGSVATVFGTNCEANLALIVAAPEMAELLARWDWQRGPVDLVYDTAALLARIATKEAP